jgi:hypothetical protein
MLLAERAGLRGEHLDPQVWSAVVGAPESDLPPPAVRRDAGGALTVVFALERGWSGAEDLCDDVDLIAHARIDDDERHRRLREILGSAAGMIHLATECRQWVAYWPVVTSPLLICSQMRLPRICNVADAASRSLLTLAASPGDLVIALAREPVGGASTNYSDLNVGDGGAAFVEHAEATARLCGPGFVVELR